MSNSKIRVSVIGASGYVGGELLRLLLSHPLVDVMLVISETFKDQPLTAAFSGIRFSGLKFSSFDKDQVLAKSDLVFCAQDHGVAMSQSAELLKAGVKLIDLSADFRLRDPVTFEKWYKTEHIASDLLATVVYGLPEINREEIRKARLVANPGCYPTASGLAVIPLLKKKLIKTDSIIIDAKSGVSGAGRGKRPLEMHFPEMNENFKAYGVAGTHRHTPEIEQTLSLAAGENITVSFTPHLLPISRGIFASCYATLRGKSTESDLVSTYKEFYEEHPFVFILDSGQLPNTKSCLSTNQCHISVTLDDRTNRVSVFSVIDNLAKGAAGQAVQNMNLMCGFDETCGLQGAGLWP